MAIDNVCAMHQQDTNPQTHDPAIAQRAEQFAVQLLTGDPGFMHDWVAYLQDLRKGPNAANRESDAAVDLHCAAPLEARLQRQPDGNVQLDVDDWRSYVNATVIQLNSGRWNAQQAQGELNKVRPEDREIAAADFNRDCLLTRTPFTANAQADGKIVVSSKNQSTMR